MSELVKKVFEWVALALPVIFTSGTACAAGNGGHGSVADLVAPGVNFIILMSFLIYKLKDPVRNYFVCQAETIEQEYENSKSAFKESELKLQMFKQKLAESDRERERILKDASEEVREFRTLFQKESAEKREKLKLDTESRIEQERKKSENELKESFLAEVINGAKEKISSSSEEKGRVSKKILAGIRN